MSRPQLFLSEADHGLQLSAADYAEADFQPPWKYERAKGTLIVLPPPGFDHELIAGRLRSYLGAYEISHPELVDYIFQESWLTVDEESDRRPDIGVYLKSNSEVFRTPERRPDLIFEIVSPGPDARDRDYVQKRAEYERRGVSEYVIVDRFEHRLTVLTLQDGHYIEQVLQPSDAYSTEMLPGLRIPLLDII